MKTSTPLNKAIPPHDYRPALQGALSWLGKRYLLAEPLNRRGEDRKPQTRSCEVLEQPSLV